ncbi:MAG: ribonuclease P protein component [Bacteroidales bacterium]|nr:ribonuclease P protein component [Bacteroidales bacterium]
MADHQFTFSKKERLCSETQITELFLNGKSFMSYPVRVVWQALKSVENPEIRVVMSVPKKKLKHAVDRNRVKRLLRECYRLNKKDLLDQVLSQGFSVRLAFIWIPAEVLGYPKVEKKMKEALVKLQKELSDLLAEGTEMATLSGNQEQKTS